jgi:hypothetical protein
LSDEKTAESTLNKQEQTHICHNYEAELSNKHIVLFKLKRNLFSFQNCLTPIQAQLNETSAKKKLSRLAQRKRRRWASGWQWLIFLGLGR